MKRKVTPQLEQEMLDYYCSVYPPVSLRFLAKKFKVSIAKIARLSSAKDWPGRRDIALKEYKKEINPSLEDVGISEIDDNKNDNKKENDNSGQNRHIKKLVKDIAINRLRYINLLDGQLTFCEEWQREYTKRNAEKELINIPDPRDVYTIMKTIKEAGESIAKAHGDNIDPDKESIANNQEVDTNYIVEKIKDYAQKN